MTVAKRLREIGNYGKAQIENVAIRLDEEWRRFKQINEQRSRLLDLALSFHRKSHIVSLSLRLFYLYLIVLDAESCNIFHWFLSALKVLRYSAL